ncbi:MAG: glycoside hydrolase family 2 TIM barrel-domain containing protein [Verrucomicrobiota bacterium]
MPSFQSPLPEIANDASSRIRYSFNDDWRFHKGDFLDAHAPEAPDQSWRKLRLPHDWAIEGPFDEKYNARCGGLPFHGIAWYRKRFFIPEHFADKAISIEFDGAMNNSEVWINGHFLGKRPYGYIGFAYDVSRYIKFGEEDENVISVKLSPEDLSSRWYPGAGLYRNSWINFTEAIRVARNGTFVNTDSLEASHAKISLKTEIENLSNVKANIEVETKIYAPDQQLVAHEITPASVLSNEQTTHTQSLVIKSPIHWDINSPNLYKAVTSLIQNGEQTDKYETTFGLRAIEFNNADGFLLNGRKVPLQGVCLHHDLGPLGAAFNLRATERQLEIMKEMGVNAIRTSHNPPSIEQLDLCDRMGILVQVEAFDCWEMAKVENGYSKYFKDSHERDLRDMIRRDRNHPSVIMWSIGNEILEQRDGSLGPKIAKRLNNICHEEDPTRPTTAGFNIYPDAIDNGLAAAVDLVGLNYKPTRYKEVLQAHPDWIVYGAETCMTPTRPS